MDKPSKDDFGFYNPDVAARATRWVQLIIRDQIMHHASTGAPSTVLDEEEVEALSVAIAGGRDDDWTVD